MKQSFPIPENCTTVTVEQVENKIVCTFEEKCILKDGDFFTWTTGSKCIAIFKEYTNETHAIASAFLYPNGTIHAIESERCSMNEVRLATESEKQILLDALENDGKKWNAELKRIEKLRWRAEYGCKYSRVQIVAGVATVVEKEDYLAEEDNNRYNSGDYFNPKTNDAQAVADRINAMFAESL